MPECACGCGEPKPRRPRGNIFRVTNRSLRKQLEEKVGGLPLLASLVKVTKMYAQDRMSLEGLGRLVQADFQKD